LRVHEGGRRACKQGEDNQGDVAHQRSVAANSRRCNAALSFC
jgi:hypothetical protein